MNPPSNLEVIMFDHDIQEVVARLAAVISRDYENRCPLLVGVLKGSFVFISDLLRCMTIDTQVDFVKLGSYGNSTTSSGVVNLVQGLSSSIEDREVVIIEDIVETGLTVNYLLNSIKDMGASSVKLCVLFEKRVKRSFSVPIDYRGITVPDRFVVGYGLDYKEHYRGVRHLCARYPSEIKCLRELGGRVATKKQ